MGRTDLVPADDVLAQELADPEMRARWQESEIAREVAVWLVGLRAKYGLSQEQLAARLGVSQLVVEWMERGL